MKVQGKVEGSINYNKERYALIKGEKGEIYVPMFNRVVEYTIHLENEVMQKTYPIEGDDMTLEIQALINHNQSTHTLQDSKKLQETIERIREEDKIMKLGILGTGMIVKDVLTMYHELGVEKTYLFSTKKIKITSIRTYEKISFR